MTLYLYIYNQSSTNRAQHHSNVQTVFRSRPMHKYPRINMLFL